MTIEHPLQSDPSPSPPSPSPVTESPEIVDHWLSRSLERFHLWGLGVLTASIVLGGASSFYLVTQPPKPDCPNVFWPFAPASVRLYCAQELASKPSLENLLKAMELVDAVGVNHPLRGAINPKLEVWSQKTLDLAEEAFHEGDLKRAIYFAKRIPTKSTASKQVADRIATWKKVWAEGEAIYARVNTAFNEEDWRQAFGIMVELLEVNNHYWSREKYEEISDRIIQAQQDEKKIAEAEQLIRTGGIDNFEKALFLVRGLGSDTIFKKSVAKVFNQVGDALIVMAEDALAREDLYSALDALGLIPEESKQWQYAKDLSEIANATADTWSASSEGYLQAIEKLNKLPKNSPIRAKIETLTQRWQGEIANLKVLEEARAQAQSGNVGDLNAAIATARSVSNSSDQWELAQQNIQDWSRQIEIFEDQPVLDQAAQLALKGDRDSLAAAIREARRIGPGRALSDDAQSRIEYWQAQISDLTVVARPARSSPPPPVSNPSQLATLLSKAKRLAATGTPQALASAIELANQVPVEAVERFDAQLEIDSWASQILNLAQAKAGENINDAIAIAQQVPRYSQVYETAQQQIRLWRNQ